jgi:N-acetylmuramoyl-L-alanine amidase
MKALLLLILILGTKNECRFSYEETRRTYYRWREALPQKRAVENLVECARRFLKLSKEFPDCEFADKALFNAGKIYLELYASSSERKFAENALNAFEDLNTRYPESPLSDDALIKAGDIMRLIFMEPESSIKFYRKAIEKNGDMKNLAMKILLSLEGKETLQKTALQDIMWWLSERYARINILFSGKVTYRYELIREKNLIKGMKIFIPNSTLENELKKEFSHGILRSIRLQKEEEGLLIELIFDEIGGYQIFHIPFPFTIVIDLFEKNYARKDLIGEVIEKYEEGIKKQKKRLTIVIDPGHGGEDCGARGKILKEKEVTLKIAKKLKRKLEEDGFNVQMTRENDTFIPLSGRTALANSLSADLFISIHINSSRNRKARGIEVYYFDKTFDKSMAEVLSAENEVPEFKSVESELEFILNDLMLSSKNAESAALAKDIKNGIVNELNYKNYRTKEVKGGPFYVLMNAKMPAVLVEALFISNPEDEKLLTKDEVLEKIAHGIFSGIKTYMLRIGEI